MCCSSTSRTTTSTSDSTVARGATSRMSVHDPDGEPRPHAPRALLDEDHCHRRLGVWVHGGSYATYPEARERRQELLGDHLKRWQEEERRLFHHMKIMKQRAAQNFKNATKANAAETRWEKFVAAGPPPPPVPDQQIYVRLRGADAARRVARLENVSIDGLFEHSLREIYHGERIGLIGRMAQARPTSSRCSQVSASPRQGRLRSVLARLLASSRRSTIAQTSSVESASTSFATESAKRNER